MSEVPSPIIWWGTFWLKPQKQVRFAKEFSSQFHVVRKRNKEIASFFDKWKWGKRGTRQRYRRSWALCPASRTFIRLSEPICHTPKILSWALSCSPKHPTALLFDKGKYSVLCGRSVCLCVPLRVYMWQYVSVQTCLLPLTAGWPCDCVGVFVCTSVFVYTCIPLGHDSSLLACCLHHQSKKKLKS